MNARKKTLRFLGQVSHRHEANRLLTEPGTAVLVFRGVARSLAIACPDGCGEQLTINLDPRTGPAWRFYAADVNAISLFPSVWRDTGCKSHFILWRSKIYWCDLSEELDAPSEQLQKLVLNNLQNHFVKYTAIAESLQQVPWAVLSACNRLCRLGFAEAGTGKQQGQFRRKGQ